MASLLGQLMSDTVSVSIQGAIDELMRQRDSAMSRSISLSSELAVALTKLQELESSQEVPPKAVKDANPKG